MNCLLSGCVTHWHCVCALCGGQISVVTRTDEDDFLLLASDGLWDVMTNQVRMSCCLGGC